MNLILPIFSLLIVIIIIFDIYSKEHLIDGELKYFNNMLIITFVNLLIQITSTAISLMDATSTIMLILNKISLGLSLWGLVYLLGYYYFVYKNEDPSKKVKYSVLGVNTLITIAILCLPLTINKYLFNEGIAAIVTLITAIIYLIPIIVFNYHIAKDGQIRKTIPLGALIIYSVIAYILKFTYPEVNFFPAVLALTQLFLYTVVEKPDVKLLKEINLMQEQVLKANRVKNEFLTNMSHEIRTPLNSIIGFSEIIKTEKDEKEIKKDAENIVVASQTLLEILSGIIDISKIEAGKMKINKTNYDLKEMLNNITDMIEPRLGDKKIKFVSKFSNDLPNIVNGDVDKVKQIIANLLSNAVKYTEEGKIIFEVKSTNENHISSLVISVTDTGRGIPKNELNNIFKKFNRLDTDKNDFANGTGLDLAITKALVEMMGGKITVKSTYGEGSTFTVYLKQKLIEYASDKIDLAEKDDICNVYPGKKALVVDDNELNLKVAVKFLQNNKIETMSFNNAEDAIAHVKKNNDFDLIFMDDMMPDMNGTVALKELKKIKDFDTPVIALTANALSGMRENYLKIGFDEYLPKPIEKYELNKLLDKLLK